MEDIIFFDGFPSQVICFGDVQPRHLGKDPIKPKPERLILMVPGFPGNAKLYSRFGGELHKLAEIPIWIVGYLGSAYGVHCPDALANKHAYELNSQVNLIKSVIARYLDGVKVVLWCHSVGGWLSLNVLNDELSLKNIVKVLMMFPVMEVVKPTVATTRAFHLSKWVLATPSIFKLVIPIAEKVGLVSFIASHKKEHLVKVLDHNNLLPMACLAMDMVLKLTTCRMLETVRRHSDKLKVYYCPTDEAAPMTSYWNLKQNIPDIDAVLDTEGLPHSFSLEYYEKGAEIANRWIKEINW